MLTPLDACCCDDDDASRCIVFSADGVVGCIMNEPRIQVRFFAQHPQLQRLAEFVVEAAPRGSGLRAGLGGGFWSGQGLRTWPIRNYRYCQATAAGRRRLSAVIVDTLMLIAFKGQC